MDLVSRLEQHRLEERRLAWEGTFAEYFQLVLERPKIAALSHARIFDMIMSAGDETDAQSRKHYRFFEQDLFGLERPLQQLVDYFSSAAKRLEVRKRILLLMGPVGGGKSTIVTLLKRGLERATRTEEGAVYAIKGCPMHEEPLHLIPDELRADLEREHGLYIEGDLCPHCRLMLQEQYGGRVEDVPVIRVAFSEKNRVGIGTFAPSDPKCVTGDTLLLTDQGLLRFDELQAMVGAEDDRFVPLRVGVSGRQGIEATSHFYNGGIKATRRVRTRLGYEIEGSMMHPLRVLRDGRPEWVRLADLREGDCVALQPGQQLFGSRTELPAFEDNTRSLQQNKHLTLPLDMTEDLARLLGYIVAEGSLTDTALWLTNGDPRVVDDITALCQRLFSVTPRVYSKRGTHAVSISISSVRLVHWLERVCGITRGAANKRIPQVVMTAPRPCVLAFLTGLFWGDGTDSARKALGSNRFKIATASRELARQVQIVLLNLGVVTATYEERIKQRYTAYSVVATGDHALDLLDVLPGLRAKSTDGAEALAPRRRRTNFETVPTLQPTVRALLQAVPYGSRAEGMRLNRYATTGISTRQPTRAVLERLVKYGERHGLDGTPELTTLRERLNDGLLWLDVVSIEDREAQVYDLTVPGTHSFCANGFVNHNSQDLAELTGSIDLATIGEYGAESDPRAYRFDGELNISNRGLMEFVEILKCVSPGTYVPTDEGLLRIEEIAPQHQGRHQDFPFELGLLTRAGVQATSHIIYNGRGPVVRLRTRKGYELAGAPEHRVLVASERGAYEWRALRDLRPADVVCISRQECFAAEAPLLPADLADLGGRQAIRFPERMTPELARLIGYFVAEGWYLKAEGGLDYGIGISNLDPEVVADVAAIAETLGLHAVAGGRCRTHIWSRALAQFFQRLGLTGRTAAEKHVPAIIRRSPRPIVAAFLRAYFDGDGTVGNLISCVTASATLAEQVQLLLLQFGIVAARRAVFNRTYGRDYYHVEVDSRNVAVFQREIGFGLTRKQQAAERLAAKDRSAHRDTLPNFAPQWAALQESLRVAAGTAQAAAGAPYRERAGVRQMLGDTTYEQLWRFARGATAPSFDAARQIVIAAGPYAEIPAELVEALEARFFHDAVAEIAEGEDDLWDFCVPANHSYVGNGFVNHNCDEKFLYSLLTLSQEQSIKTSRFAMIYADECIISHTNENEYNSFVGNKKAEALQDRIILVKVPYNLRVSDEVRIYEKLLRQSDLKTVHIAPHTLWIASVFAVLSRLEPSKKAGMSLIKKLRLYDGQDVEGFNQRDVKELQDETVREGMDGISPRYVINRLSNALVKDGCTCINPIDALRALRDGLEQHASLTREDRERLLNLIAEARKEYDEISKKEVQKAFVYSFEESARTLLNNYLDNVEAYCNKQKMRDPITDEEMEPDEHLMRSIEEQIGVSENAKRAFREEILIRISTLARRNQQFDYNSHERLREAIEKKLFSDLKDVVKITTSTKTPDAEQLRRINDVIARLIDQHGYCPVCANELVRYTGALLAR